MATPNEIQADPTKWLTGSALIAARKAASQPVQPVQAPQPIQPVSTQPVQPTQVSTQPAQAQPVTQIQADPTSGLTGSALIEARKAAQVAQTPVQAPVQTPTQAPVQAPVQTTPQKPVQTTPDFNTWVGREQDIIANLSEGLKSDATVQKAIQSGDIATFKQKYWYDQADETKKRLLDQFFTTNQPRDEGSFYNLLRSGQQITSPTLTRLPAFKIAQERANDFSKFSQYSVNQISSALLSGSLIEGTKVYQDLQNDPAMKAKLDQARTFNTASSKTTDQRGIELNVSADILKNNQTTAQMLEDNFISPDEYRQALNTTEIDVQRKDVEASRIKYDTLKATYDGVEDDVEKEYGTISSSAKAALIADRRKGIYRDLSVAESTYNAKLGTLTDMKKEAAAIFDQNISLYKDSLNAKRDEERLALQFEYANPSITSSNPRIAQVAAQKIIGEALAFAQTNGIPVQRNSGQILSDAQSYATANGVSLSDALQETFTKPFVAKNEYRAALSNIQDSKTPASKLQIVWVDPKTGNNIYGTLNKDGSITTASFTGATGGTDFTGIAYKYPGVAAYKNNNPAGITWNANFDNNSWTAKALADAGIGFTKWTARPASEWGNYVKFNSIEEGLAAQRVIMTQTYGNSTVWKMLSSWVGTSEWPAYAKQVAWAAWVDVNANVSSLSKTQLDALQIAKIKKESPWLYNELVNANIVSSGGINFSSTAGTQEQKVSEDAKTWIDLWNTWAMDLETIMTKIGSAKESLPLKTELTRYVNEQWGVAWRKKDDPAVVKLESFRDVAKSLISNKEQLENVSGGYQFSPWDSLTQEKQTYLSKVQNLLENKTLQSLIDAKSQGATFGALSNTELAMLQSSSSALAGAAVRDSDGKITGFSMTEEEFKKQLENIEKSYSDNIKRMVGGGNQYSWASIMPKPGTATQDFLLNNR